MPRELAARLRCATSFRLCSRQELQLLRRDWQWRAFEDRAASVREIQRATDQSNSSSGTRRQPPTRAQGTQAHMGCGGCLKSHAGD